MMPPPVVIGLTVCDYVIIEESTHKTTLVGNFRTLRLQEFPGSPLPFCVYVAFTDALGNATVELTVTDWETEETIYRLSQTVRFRDRFQEIGLLFRIPEIVFPEPGIYLFSIIVDDDTVASRRVHIFSAEELPSVEESP